MSGAARREADYRAALAVDQGWYTMKRLGGRDGALWLWGQYVTEDTTRLNPDAGLDDFATLGILPQKGKPAASPPPVDPRILDVCRAYAFIGTLPNQRAAFTNPEWPHPLTIAQMVVLIYYGWRVGERIPAHTGNREHYRETAKRFGIGGQSGDPAVARLLAELPEIRHSRNPAEYVHGKRRWAVERMARFLTEQSPKESAPC